MGSFQTLADLLTELPEKIPFNLNGSVEIAQITSPDLTIFPRSIEEAHDTIA